MRILVHGITGHMGQIVLSLLNEGYAGCSFAGGVSPDVSIEKDNLFRSFSSCSVSADAVVDFSFHSGVGELLSYCVSNKLPVVVATTGHM